MAGERWIFTKSQLEDTPSRKNGIDSDKELTYRQQAANLIQEMGQRLQVTQLCINTAIVYMHRFYMFHPFTKFHRNAMASACLFLAAKVEEQPRKLEHVLKVTHLCLHKEGPSLDTKSNEYLEQAHELVVNENILLQTLGFDLTVDHPHTHVVKTCQLVRDKHGARIADDLMRQIDPPTKDLAQTSYFLATNSLHLTTMCLQLKPTLVACVCVHLACRWSSWEIPRSSEGREWYWYMDKNVTEEKLEELTQDFLNILDKCPSKLRKKIMMWKSGKDHKEENYAPSEKKPKLDSPSSSSSKAHTSSSHHHHHHHASSSHEQKPDRKHNSSHVKQESTTPVSSKLTTELSSGSTGSHSQTTVNVTSSKSGVSHSAGAANKNVNSSNSPVVSNAVAPPSATTTTTTKTTLKEYTERKERERLERLALEKAAHERRERERNVQYGKVETEQLVQDAAKRPIKTESADLEVTKKHVKLEHSHQNASETAVKTEHVDYDRKNKTEHSQHSSSEGKLKKSHHGHHHHHKHSGSEIVPGSETKLKIKTDSSSSVHSVKKESSSPLKLKIKMPKDQSPHQEKHKTASPASQSSEQKVPPLKITHSSKIHADGSTTKHERSEQHRGKSHKSSRHSHTEQSAGNNDGNHSGTNGRSDLKLHINMSALSSRPSSSEKKDKRSHRDMDGSKRSSSQPTVQSSSQHSGHPWTVSEFMSQKIPSGASSSKKRQHSPAAADLLNDVSHRNKVSRSDSTMRRSSSNHSLVSMDMSDTGSLSGSGSDHFIETENPLRGLNQSVNSMTNSPLVTDNTKQTLDHSIQVIQQVIERQKAQMAATPTNQLPAPQYPQMVPVHSQPPIQSLFDIDFLSDDTLPPLPGDPPQRPPTPPL